MTKKGITLSLLVLLKLVIQYFAIDTGYELHRDEYLHLDLGKHLAWGYSSVPPVTAWISYLILHLGNSVLLVKFVPALFGVLTMVVVWKTIEELNGNLFALIIGSVCIIFSALLRLNTLYQPNSLEYLLWTLVFYTLIKFINSENSKWLYIASITIAIGFLNKYNIAFLLLGLFPALLITSHRTVYLNKHFYFAIFLALIIVSPNIIWQYNNDFPVFHHLKDLSETQLVNVNRFDFLKEQLLFFVGSLYVLILAIISLFKYTPFKKYQVFFWSYIFTISIFTFFKAKGYYAIGLYPILLAFGSVYIEKLFAKNERSEVTHEQNQSEKLTERTAKRMRMLKYLRPIVVVIPIVIMVPILPFILPMLTPDEIIEKTDSFERIGLLRWEDGKNHTLPQDYADMLGWRELASIVDIAFDSITEKKNTIIHCDNYGQAGAINFYSSQKFTQAVSMNADYINWYPLDKMEIINVILVKENTDSDVNREKEKPLFEKITLIGEIKNKYARELGTKVFLLKGSKQSINEILKEEIKERKRKRS